MSVLHFQLSILKNVGHPVSTCSLKFRRHEKGRIRLQGSNCVYQNYGRLGLAAGCARSETCPISAVRDGQVSQNHQGPHLRHTFRKRPLPNHTDQNAEKPHFYSFSSAALLRPCQNGTCWARPAQKWAFPKLGVRTSFRSSLGNPTMEPLTLAALQLCADPTASMQFGLVFFFFWLRFWVRTWQIRKARSSKIYGFEFGD